MPIMKLMLKHKSIDDIDTNKVSLIFDMLLSTTPNDSIYCLYNSN